MKSFIALCVCIVFLFCAGLGFYPKWKLTRTEATIGWDVSGYYFYLPAIFIYHDLKHLEFKDSILSKYYPTPDLQQAYQHDNGNYILKYPAGMALQYLPFFLVSHWYASTHESIPSDGFSWPYQLAISLGSLLVACCGLWFLRRALLIYFSDSIVAIVLCIIVFATNYLDYAAINGAMSHNYLFTLYAILITCVIHYYKSPTSSKAIACGLVLGLMILTRPTEMLALCIPILWGVNSSDQWRERVQFWREHRQDLTAFSIALFLIGSVQIAYWLYVAGSPLVYSYQDQGFKFFKPHLVNGILSYRSGWLVYTPVMLLSIVGLLWMLKKKYTMRLAVFVFTVLCIWITWSWNGWTYGGALGQRAMVQSYAVLAFPLAACLVEISNAKRWIRISTSIFIGLCAFYNVWLTYHAHGGLLRPGEMTKAYFWKIFGRIHVPDTAQFLLDTNEQYAGQTSNANTLLKDDYNAIHPACTLPTIAADESICIPPGSGEHLLGTIPWNNSKADWIRATADFQIEHREWDVWRQGRFTIELWENDNIIKSKYIRPIRILEHKEGKRLSVDIKVPKKPFHKIRVLYVTDQSTVPILIDNLDVIAF